MLLQCASRRGRLHILLQWYAVGQVNKAKTAPLRWCENQCLSSMASTGPADDARALRAPTTCPQHVVRSFSDSNTPTGSNMPCCFADYTGGEKERLLPAAATPFNPHILARGSTSSVWGVLPQRAVDVSHRPSVTGGPRRSCVASWGCFLASENVWCCPAAGSLLGPGLTRRCNAVFCCCWCLAAAGRRARLPPHPPESTALQPPRPGAAHAPCLYFAGGGFCF